MTTSHFYRHIVLTLLILMLGFPLLANRPALKNRVVILDAGHGTLNYDSHIVNGGKETRDKIPEHKLTLHMAEAFKKELVDQGAIVYLTRNTTDYWRQAYNSVDDNKARAVFANEMGADVFISLHCDWHPNSRVKGVTTLYAKRDSKKLANSLHSSLVRGIKAKDRKVKRDTFTILDHAEIPAVIIETGFMSHRKEHKKLKSPTYQKKIAQSLTKGLLRYFQNYRH
ncbi:hypothetical protein BVX98_04850 [bacterium F11]|nr:hypothetical protein BVX98_04850 [bacterium F11]